VTDSRRQTKTGGKDAVDGWIQGDLALSVGRPPTAPPDGFVWRRLTDLARLESGHTPSRKIAGYWSGGDIPWITVKEAAAHHGQVIFETDEYITAEGEQNSSARLLPANTVSHADRLAWVCRRNGPANDNKPGFGELGLWAGT